MSDLITRLYLLFNNYHHCYDDDQWSTSSPSSSSSPSTLLLYYCYHLHIFLVLHCPDNEALTVWDRVLDWLIWYDSLPMLLGQLNHAPKYLALVIWTYGVSPVAMCRSRDLTWRDWAIRAWPRGTSRFLWCSPRVWWAHSLQSNGFVRSSASVSDADEDMNYRRHE